jgi:hypothetical protein
MKIDEISPADSVNSGDDGVHSLHLQERMVGWMKGNGVGLADIAKVVVGTLGVHTLVTNAADDFAARVASGIMSD